MTMYTTEVSKPVVVTHKFKVGDKIRGRYGDHHLGLITHEIEAIELSPMDDGKPAYRYRVRMS